MIIYLDNNNNYKSTTMFHQQTTSINMNNDSEIPMNYIDLTLIKKYNILEEPLLALEINPIYINSRQQITFIQNIIDSIPIIEKNDITSQEVKKILINKQFSSSFFTIYKIDNQFCVFEYFGNKKYKFISIIYKNYKNIILTKKNVEIVGKQINEYYQEFKIKIISSNVSLKKIYKNIRDIRGYVQPSNYAMYIIDTPEFQRLRDLKQLGTCFYVFPTATHTRFEHSLGTYYLACQILDRISQDLERTNISNYLSGIKELQNYFKRTYGNNKYVFDNYVKELIKIAALCHDLGHGPYSHMFDDHFLAGIKELNNHENRDHEARSINILRKVIKEHKILKNIIMDDEIDFMGHLMHPEESHTGFIYQIVSNSLNGLDIDKFDYIERDSTMINRKIDFDYSRLINDIKIIDNNICYPNTITTEIYRLFETRYSLHKDIYTHKSVVSAQFLIVELLRLLDPIFKISESINDLNRFCKFTDSYIMNLVNVSLNEYDNRLTTEEKEKLNQAKKIIDRLSCHNSYMCIEKITHKEKPKTITIDDFKACIQNEKVLNNIMIYQNKIGFVSGNKNPLNSIYAYDTKTSMEPELNSFKIDFDREIAIKPTNYQEFNTYIFYKERGDLEGINQVKKAIKLLSI
jgi:HD superfamily phosphohydrolase